MDISTWIAYDKELLLSFNGSESLFFDGLVKTLTTASTWIPMYVALLWMVIRNNDNWKKILLIVGCALVCVLLAGSVDDMFVKPLVARWRPTRDGEIGVLVDVVNGYRGGDYGFFSAHASNTFSIAVFFALLIRSRVLSVALILWSLTNCWTRVYLGVHYPGDILVGLLWGGIVGTCVWFLHGAILRRISYSSKNYISSQYTSTGYQITDTNAVVCMLLFTLAYALIKACLFLNV